MSGTAIGDGTSACWIVRPRALDSAHHNDWPAWLAAMVCAAIGLAFALAGAWLVLPFCGIEIVALWLALRHLHRHCNDYERIYRDADHLVVERLCGRQTERHELHPHWARLRILEPPNGSSCQLFIGSHGKEIEIGRQLASEEKKALARQLKQRLGV